MTHENLELRAWLAVNLMGLHKMQWIGLPGGDPVTVARAALAPKETTDAK